MTANTTINRKLSGEYELGNRKLQFWSLAPAFKVDWSMNTVPGYTRHFVWLVDEDGRFVHAVVAPEVSKVLKVNVVMHHDIRRRILTQTTPAFPSGRGWVSVGPDQEQIDAKLLALAGMYADGSLINDLGRAGN